MRYALRRKKDGKFYMGRENWRDKRWSEDFQSCWLYKQVGGPKHTLAGLGYLPWNEGGKEQTDADRRALWNKRFYEEYEILEVTLKLVEVPVGI